MVYITTVEADCNGFKSLEQIVSIDIAEVQRIAVVWHFDHERSLCVAQNWKLQVKIGLLYWKLLKDIMTGV